MDAAVYAGIWLFTLAVLVVFLWGLRRFVLRCAARAEDLACPNCRYLIRGREDATVCAECGCAFAGNSPIVPRSKWWLVADMGWLLGCVAVGVVVVVLLPAKQAYPISFRFRPDRETEEKLQRDWARSSEEYFPLLDSLRGSRRSSRWVWPSMAGPRAELVLPGTHRDGPTVLRLIVEGSPDDVSLQIEPRALRCDYELRGGVMGSGPLSAETLFTWLDAWGYPRGRPDVATSVPWIERWLLAFLTDAHQELWESVDSHPVQIHTHVSGNSLHTWPPIVPSALVLVVAGLVGHRGGRRIARTLQVPA